MKCPNCYAENPETSQFCGNCAAPLKKTSQKEESPPTEKEVSPDQTKTLWSTSQALSIGSTFASRFQTIEELGKGGMGQVYKVIDSKVNEKIALKLLNPEIAGKEKHAERFRNELKLARKISHKHVCRMYDFSESEGISYITMEYISGEDLKSLIRRIGQFTVGKAIVIARQVCEGLAEAHRLGVVHRDLKPHNIMIDKNGDAKIMDFGIARSLRGKGITDTGEIFGTPEYMSPEHVEGKEVDQRTDIYSLGIIMYEMLLGKVPFEGETPVSVALKQKTAEPVAAAIGVGLPIQEPAGNMIIDVGGGTTEIAVISLAGIVFSRSIRIGGDEMDQAIIDYLKKTYNLMVGERTSEDIKIKVGSAFPLEEELTMEVRGRDLVAGLPKMITISSEEVREALAEPIAQIIESVSHAIFNTPLQT